ncbi:disease resistance protein RPM1 [Vigna unguiculata]|uniref:Disease resistance protein RPM1 n=1 Tax=Vigna unguiculata TaxID=3917 RepID=A0A4D6M578_VIGUN|nr:disease resistance protein RPM1 [Vigna unguiculata]
MEVIAQIVLQNLSSFAQEEFGIIWNLKDDVQQMKSTVSAIKAVLLDAEAKTNNLQISNWLEELKDVLYDADDLLNDISSEAMKRKVIGSSTVLRKIQIFFSQENQIAYSFKLGHQMKAIQKRLDAIAKNKITLQLTDRPLETPIAYREQRQTYSFVREDDVIGREEEKKLLKSYLLDTKVSVIDNVSVLAIVGFGGLGKTALAQLVFNDNAVQCYFEQKMWVCVSDEFDMRKIAEKMIGNDKNSEIEQLQQDLRNKVRGKKFLLVLDDVWNEDRELWLKLKSLVVEGGLDLERSWKLFSRVAFDEGKEPNDLEFMKCLRVLTLSGLHLITIPNSIRELKQLRYLDLSMNKFLTLKLSRCGELKELPSDISRSLRHLELNDCGKLTCMPCGLGQLTNLQTLTHFLLDSKSKNVDISELSGLNNLRGKLVIKWLDSLRENAAVVESANILLEKQHLQELELRWRLGVNSLWRDPIEERLKMENEKIYIDEPLLKKDEKIMQGLQPHHSIKRLVIDGYCGKSLPDWIGNLSSLLSLEISNCNGLKSLPDGIRDLVSLQRLCIYNCSLLEKRCARGNGVEWSKIAHIPKVLVSAFTPTDLRYGSMVHTALSKFL